MEKDKINKEIQNYRYVLESSRSINGCEDNALGKWYFSSKAEAWRAAKDCAEREREAAAKRCREVKFLIYEIWGQKIEMSYTEANREGGTDDWRYCFEVKDNPHYIGTSSDV